MLFRSPSQSDSQDVGKADYAHLCLTAQMLYPYQKLSNASAATVNSGSHLCTGLIHFIFRPLFNILLPDIHTSFLSFPFHQFLIMLFFCFFPILSVSIRLPTSNNSGRYQSSRCKTNYDSHSSSVSCGSFGVLSSAAFNSSADFSKEDKNPLSIRYSASSPLLVR